jgi:hypothetical protein
MTESIYVLSVDGTALRDAIVHALAVSLAWPASTTKRCSSCPDDRYRSPITVGLVYAACGYTDAAFEDISRALVGLDYLPMCLTAHPKQIRAFESVEFTCQGRRRRLAPEMLL